LKSGKTTLASQFPNALLLATEKGYNAIPGINVADVPNYLEFKKAVKQLEDPEVKKMFDTVVIDTYSLLYKRAEKFILNREGVDKLADVPYGAAYGMVSSLVEDDLIKITQMGYGLVLICHAKTSTVSDGAVAVTTIEPDLDKRANKVANRLVDATICLYNDGESRKLYPRDYTIQKGPETIVVRAGNRFPTLDKPIALGYEPLVNAIAESMNSMGTKLIDKKVEAAAVEEKKELDFNAIVNEIGTIAKGLYVKDQNEGSSLMKEYKAIVEDYLGTGKGVKDASEAQVEILDSILSELKAKF